jgi:hypothetical protein
LKEKSTIQIDKVKGGMGDWKINLKDLPRIKQRKVKKMN